MKFNPNIRVKLVSIEEGITALGFRRIASIARKLNPDAEIYFIPVGNLYSLATHLFPNNKIKFNDKDIEMIARELAGADLLCFSCMSPSAEYAVKISEAVRRINPGIFILWGGTHCIISPEDAICHTDAICTSEGEMPFEEFYKNFSEGRDYLTTESMWFNTKRGIIKNKNRVLCTTDELSSFPYLFYDYTCRIYDPKSKIFRKFTKYDYTRYNGLSYRTVWSIGCPFSCRYCANDAFLKNDKNYGKIRYASVQHLLGEIETALDIYPFISTVVFYDDNFINIPEDILRDFSEEYKRRINLPFVIFGLNPNFITREKIELLAKAGMNRVRMGIQSGSERILSFYNRPTPLFKIRESAGILAEAAKNYKMIPPAYDIISDNPIETKDDITQTLNLLYGLERPYTLTVFSLRALPKTKLWDYFQSHPSVDICSQTTSYLETKKSMANILLYFLAIVKPPKVIFLWLLGYVKGYQERQRYHPILYLLAKSTYLFFRGIEHLRKLDFTTIVGPAGYFLWKIGFIKSRFRKTSKNKILYSMEISNVQQ